MFFRLTIPAPEALAARISDALAEAPGPEPMASGHFSRGENWCAEALYEAEPDVAVLARHLRAALGDGADGIAPAVEPVENRDWVAESQRGLGPVSAGRFLIHGGHDAGTAPAGAIPIRIEAGQAFGTGHHETTTGCLIAYTRAARRRRFRNVLDLGCGTAVLGIAAARLQHARVTATDIDPVAIRVARGNAAANRVQGLIRFALADGPCHAAIAAAAPFDLIFANILAGPLMRMARDLARAAAPGATIILSGLLDHQAPAVAARYRAAGCVLRERLSQKGWAALTLEAPDRPGEEDVRRARGPRAPNSP